MVGYRVSLAESAVPTSRPEPSFMHCVHVLGAVAIALVLGIPYAATRRTLPLDCTAWATEDGRLRVAIAAVALGLALVAVAIALVATALSFKPNAIRHPLWGVWSLASTAYALGICCYPLWLNGVLAAGNGELFNELDPKRVAPFRWFGSWLDYPSGLLTLGIVILMAATPLVAGRLLIQLVRRRWSWALAAEATLPLTWACLHRPLVQALAWSLD